MTLNNNQRLKLGIGGGVGGSLDKNKSAEATGRSGMEYPKVGIQYSIPSENFEKPVQFSEF